MLTASTRPPKAPDTNRRPKGYRVTPEAPDRGLFTGVLVGLALSVTFFWAPLVWALTR